VNGRRPEGPQGKDGSSASNGANGKNGANGDHRHGTERLYEDISSIRSRLSGLISELDRRRHDAVDVKLQVRRHPISFVLVAVAAVGVVGGLVAWRLVARRHRNRLVTRLRGLRSVLGRVVRDPERMAQRTPRLGTRLLHAGGEATAGIVAKRLAERLLGPAPGH
jgi:hypothetical protein